MTRTFERNASLLALLVVVSVVISSGNTVQAIPHERAITDSQSGNNSQAGNDSQAGWAEVSENPDGSTIPTRFNPSSFLPIWKLLSYDQKVQFVSGYIQGWKDAARVTDVAISYVRDNPKNAVDGLEKLKSLYDLSDLKPNSVVDQIDRYYADPLNSEATLSLAISAARSDAGGQ